jgi:PAS domain S-box-containing protein
MMSGYFDNAVPLDHTYERLQAIVASAMDAIITIDDQQQIIGFNPAAEKMFRISATKALNSPIARFIPHRFRDKHEEHIQHFGQTGETSRAMGAVSALRADGEEFPVEASISQAMAGTERLSTVIMRDITEREANEKAQALLAREVDHRAKNILAVVSSLVSLTQAPNRQAYIESLTGRIAAMSRAHGLLAQQRWKGAALARVAVEELEAHAEPENFTCSGLDLQLSSRAVQPIGMLIHELATNAVKYGALSVAEGQVHLGWSQQSSGAIRLHWRETGGPPLTSPGEPGFGTLLIKQIVENQLGGALQPAWTREGYEMLLTLPDTVLQFSPEMPITPADDDQSGGTGPRSSLPQKSENTAGGTILIVEDEPLLAMQLSASLKEYGWSVLGVAGSIEDANRILADKARPDAAILDVDLGGAPVFPLARSLRRSGIPFIFCTGYEDLDYSSEFSNCTSVRKPATVLQIVRALREVVRAAHPDAAPCQ